MATVSHWVQAFRLRTLPLSAAVILAGSALVYVPGVFNWSIFILSLLTAFLLQILSNLANDYGDFSAGTDDMGRIGPKRTMQQGLITMSQMRWALIVTIVLCLASGLGLLFISFSIKEMMYIIVFLMIGLVCIWAALKYTIGKSAYGYRGFGDIAVLFFFGGVGVLGTAYLHVHVFVLPFIWIMLAFGLLSSAVLNLNNMRDHINDKAHNKNTLVVKIGLPAAKVYHVCMVVTAILSLIVFTVMYATHWSQYVFLITSVPFMLDLIRIYKSTPEQMDLFLKRTAIFTFLTGVLFFAGRIISFL